MITTTTCIILQNSLLRRLNQSQKIKHSKIHLNEVCKQNKTFNHKKYANGKQFLWEWLCRDTHNLYPFFSSVLSVLIFVQMHASVFEGALHYDLIHVKVRGQPQISSFTFHLIWDRVWSLVYCCVH